MAYRYPTPQQPSQLCSCTRPPSHSPHRHYRAAHHSPQEGVEHAVHEQVGGQQPVHAGQGVAAAAGLAGARGPLGNTTPGLSVNGQRQRLPGQEALHLQRRLA